MRNGEREEIEEMRNEIKRRNAKWGMRWEMRRNEKDIGRNVKWEMLNEKR